MGIAMTQIDTAKIPKVAMDFMNEDHQEAGDLLNQLQDKLEQGTDAEVESALTAFYQHSAEHFAREEAEMIRVDFPPYSCHKAEHERVLAEMCDVLALWQQGHSREKLVSYIDDVVINWFVNHINTMDTVTATFISRQAIAC
ncbi:MAG: hemerythrin family protein [Motiliproteus sp.]|nr:hemerythrin family protein [Motiliproteus sp.]MCW9053092.1 hemerythrin family protein [Motiliproteus sp.]